MLSDLAVKKLKIESEDQENNNIEYKHSNSSFESESDVYPLKRRDTLFDSRENLSTLQFSSLYKNLQNHILDLIIYGWCSK